MPTTYKKTVLQNDLIESYGFSTASRGPRDNYFPNLTVRTDFARGDYEYFRPGEKIPKKGPDLIKFCMDMYDRVGIVYNVLNLMADFASNGIELVHPIKSQERFYQKWFEKVKGQERSSAMLNMAYRAGSLVAERSDGILELEESREWKKAGASDTAKARKIQIPLRYTIHSPLAMEVVGGEVASFTGKPIFLLKIGSDLMQAINLLKTNPLAVPKEQLNKLLGEIPKILIDPKNRRAGYLELDQSKLYPMHYKKDDCEIWAKPLINSILEDLVELAKAKLSDNTALDGVISTIRLWKLGIYDPAHPNSSILPTRAGIQKLRNVLSSHSSGGVLDLVWGPELDCKEISTSTHNYLGEAKYKPIWTNIYEGLGVPPTLTGGGSSSGMTNNVLSLRTLVERLEYGRNILVEFWNKQIKLVQKAMGFSKPAKVTFPEMSLSDDATMKKLLIDLVDRDIISAEAVQKNFGFVPESQNSQVKREYKKRDKKISPPKASPLHNPNTENEMRKIALQGGSVTPSEVGLELDEKKAGEKSMLEKQAKLAPKPDPNLKFNPKKSDNGRPKNSTDKSPRKQKVVTPRKAALDKFIWAESTQAQISKIVTPVVTASLKKKNLRQLSVEETQALEEIKFGVLCNLDSSQAITEEYVYKLIEEKIPGWAISGLNEARKDFIEQYHREPTIEEVRQLQSSVYVQNSISD